MTFWIRLSWLVMTASFVALLGAAIWLLVRRRQARDADAIGNGLGDPLEFSLENYRPMERFRWEEDLLFLQSQPGYRPEIGKRWKRERRRVFRLYLTELKGAFRVLHTKARALVANSDADSAELVWVLMRQRWTFVRVSALLEVRLALMWAGAGNVDAEPLIQLLEAMRADLSRRSAPQAA